MSKRILVLGWARLRNQAREGSGYNLVASEQAAGLAARGHQVVYIRSGMDYAFPPGPRVRYRETWRGVRCYDSVNSPNLSPAGSNFRNVEAEFAAPEHTDSIVRAATDLFHGERAHAALIHSLEGFGFDLIGALEDAGVRAIVTPHNYFFVCPQVDLLRGEGAICHDFEGGAQCEGCIEAPQPGRAKLKRGIEQAVELAVGETTARYGKWVFAQLKGGTGDPEPFEPWAVGEGGRFEPVEGDEFSNAETQLLDANERFLASDVHLKVLDRSPYGRRRAAGVAALNRASLVTPPSAFLGEVYVKMGLDRSKLKVVRLGLPHLDRISAAAKASPFAEAPPWAPGCGRPLRIAFLGTVRSNKGLEVFVRAIESLDDVTRSKCRFIIRAFGHDAPYRRRLAHLPEVSMLGGYDPIDLIGMAADYDVGVLPHVWFENSPIVMLEHLHGGRPVIASRLGGVPEWVRDGVNGWLVPGGESEAMAQAIVSVVSEDAAIPRDVGSPLLTTVCAHLDEVESLFSHADACSR
ncbi:MAG: glycosyltransferase family 4 protein [Planctomycetota bacterium]